MAKFKNLLTENVRNLVTRHLGEEASFVPCNGAAVTVNVVFDNSFELVDPDTETVISSNQPKIFANISDYSKGINKGDKFILEGKKYVVWTVQEDGQGGAEVFLHRHQI